MSKRFLEGAEIEVTTDTDGSYVLVAPNDFGDLFPVATVFKPDIAGLFAAAPELYEALRTIYDSCLEDRALARLAYDALIKAEGRKP